MNSLELQNRILKVALMRIATHKDIDADAELSPYDERGDIMWRKGLGTGHRRCAQMASEAINAAKALKGSNDE